MKTKLSENVISQKNTDEKPLILYLCKTSEFEYYVLAYHPTEAKDKVEAMLEEENYGFSKSRKVKKIITIATQIMPALNSKHFLSSDDNLLI